MDGVSTVHSVYDKVKRPVRCSIMLQLHELYSHNEPFTVAYLLKPGSQCLKQSQGSIVHNYKSFVAEELVIFFEKVNQIHYAVILSNTKVERNG
jgi:hypothetical protein